MKKVKWMSLLLAAMCSLLFVLSACGEDEDKKLVPPEPSVLVAYFSATGTTKSIAEKIAELTGGTLYQIVPAEPYTDADLEYGNALSRASQEDADPHVRPKIEGSVSDMGDFNVVYLGYPIWFGEAPKIIYTFLESYDFSGKPIVPFCTSGSSGIEGSLPELKAIASSATWLTGKRFSSSASMSDVKSWINSLQG